MHSVVKSDVSNTASQRSPRNFAEGNETTGTPAAETKTSLSSSNEATTRDSNTAVEATGSAAATTSVFDLISLSCF